MKYGNIVDHFNFRFAHRYLEVDFITNTKNVSRFLGFNNTNQMLWKGDDIVMQIIKFDDHQHQAMTTICMPKEELLFTILLVRRNYDDIDVKATKLNHLILKGRNLKVQSSYGCNIQHQTDIGSDISASPQSNFDMKFLVTFNILILLGMKIVLLST